MNTDTLNGGRKINITFEDGTTREIIVRQIRVCEYQEAFPKIDNEIALDAFVSCLSVAEVGKLTPESYEFLNTTVQEVNAKGFFVWSARQLERAQKQMAAMSPEMVNLILDRGAQALKPQSPFSQRPQG
jgi:hypothetical protein